MLRKNSQNFVFANFGTFFAITDAKGMGMRSVQKTIEKRIESKGIGLHTGKEVYLCLSPLPPDSGIWFRRIDLPHKPYIKATGDKVTQTSLCTTLGNNGSGVSTVEHLMAAFAGLGIHNILVEVDAPEIPIFDGSAQHFVELLEKAGIRNQKATSDVFALNRKFSISQEDKKITYYPNKELIVSFTIDFDHPLLKEQEYTFRFSEDNFANEISKARTFGFLKDVEAMKRCGFARGGSLENAVVIDEDGVLNPEGLRYPNEFVRHKILDFLGDLYLYGMPIRGHFVVYKSGHTLNNLFIRALKNGKGEEKPFLSPGQEIPSAFSIGQATFNISSA